MIGIALLIFVGYSFARLAKEHQRNQWLYGFIGVATFFVSQLVVGFIMGFVLVIAGNESFLDGSAGTSLLLNLIGIVVGIAAAFGLRAILKRNWEKNPVTNDEILDSEL